MRAAWATGLTPKVIKLGIVLLCQGRLACDDVDTEGGQVALAIDSQALVGVAGQRSFDRAGTDPEPAGGHQVVQQLTSDGADRSMVVSAMTFAACTIRSRAAWTATVKLARSG